MIRTNDELLNFFLLRENLDNEVTIRENIFEPGDTIIQQGKNGQFVHIVKQGIAKCFVMEQNGKEFVQEFFGKGELLGEIEVLKDTLAFSNVVALTQMVTFGISKSDFYRLMESTKGFGVVLARALATKLRDTAIRASYQQTFPLNQNFDKLIELSFNQAGILSKKDISDYLGITLRSLNRMLKEKRIQPKFRLD
jgi:CRP-like cAMP-binding protein